MPSTFSLGDAVLARNPWPLCEPLRLPHNKRRVCPESCRLPAGGSSVVTTAGGPHGKHPVHLGEWCHSLKRCRDGDKNLATCLPQPGRARCSGQAHCDGSHRTVSPEGNPRGDSTESGQDVVREQKTEFVESLDCASLSPTHIQDTRHLAQL